MALIAAMCVSSAPVSAAYHSFSVDSTITLQRLENNDLHDRGGRIRNYRSGKDIVNVPRMYLSTPHGNGESGCLERLRRQGL
jgi:hypothetical protein